MKNPVFRLALGAKRWQNQILLTGMTASLCTLALPSLAFPINFAPGDYDNTANTVVSGPTPVYNQTTGLFRDAIWWSLNNGQPRVGSPDYINQNYSLVLSGNQAVPGTGPYTALNFTGPAVSGGQSYLTVYDTTPADGTANKNTFDATQGLTISADVMFTIHSVSAGVVALYNEGQDGLALLAHNGGGNNPDHARVDLIWQSSGQGTVLSSTTLPYATLTQLNWYNINMALSVSGDTWSMTGNIYSHLIGTDPTSGLGSLIGNVVYSGSVSAMSLTNPGEVGILAMGNEAIASPDSVGVSVTDFNVVPEPGTASLLGLGALAWLLRKRR